MVSSLSSPRAGVCLLLLVCAVSALDNNGVYRIFPRKRTPLRYTAPATDQQLFEAHPAGVSSKQTVYPSKSSAEPFSFQNHASEMLASSSAKSSKGAKHSKRSSDQKPNIDAYSQLASSATVGKGKSGKRAHTSNLFYHTPPNSGKASKSKGYEKAATSSSTTTSSTASSTAAAKTTSSTVSATTTSSTVSATTITATSRTTSSAIPSNGKSEKKASKSNLFYHNPPKGGKASKSTGGVQMATTTTTTSSTTTSSELNSSTAAIETTSTTAPQTMATSAAITSDATSAATTLIALSGTTTKISATSVATTGESSSTTIPQTIVKSAAITSEATSAATTSIVFLGTTTSISATSAASTGELSSTTVPQTTVTSAATTSESSSSEPVSTTTTSPSSGLSKCLDPNPYTFEKPNDEFPKTPWTTGGDGVWEINKNAKEGENAIKSPDLVGSSTKAFSNATLALDCKDFPGGVLTFNVRAPVVPPYDVFIWYVDGVEVGRLAGEREWKAIPVPIAPGPHTVDFQYLYNEFENPDVLSISVPDVREGAVWINNVSLEEGV